MLLKEKSVMLHIRGIIIAIILCYTIVFLLLAQRSSTRESNSQPQRGDICDRGTQVINRKVCGGRKGYDQQR